MVLIKIWNKLFAGHNTEHAIIKALEIPCYEQSKYIFYTLI